MGFLDDIGGYALDTGIGVLSGAPYGPAGATLGGIRGAYGHYQREKAAGARKKGIKEAQAMLDALAASQREQRSKDIERALGFFGPAQNALKNMYGSGPVGPKPWEVPGMMPPGSEKFFG